MSSAVLLFIVSWLFYALIMVLFALLLIYAIKSLKRYSESKQL